VIAWDTPYSKGSNHLSLSNLINRKRPYEFIDKFIK